MALAIVQHKSAILGNAIPGSLTITSAPTAGNLIIASVGVNAGPTALTINASSWTLIGKSINPQNTTELALVLARYAQPGDTSSLPAFCTSGSTYSAPVVWEVSGVVGNLADDIVAVICDFASTQATLPVPEWDCPVNGALALLAAHKYNGSTNPTNSDGTWTGDEAQNNSGNFGSAAGWHKALNDTDASAAAQTITFGAVNNPGAVVMVVLGDTALADRPYVRAKRSASGSGAPIQLDTFLAPLVGSLALGFIDWNNGGAASPTLGASWTELASVAGGTGKMVIAAGRYIGGADTSLFPFLVTSGSTFHMQHATEIAGPMAGVLATDVTSAAAVRTAGAASQTTTSANTVNADQLGIIHAANYNASTELAIDSGFQVFAHTLDFGNYGASLTAEKHFAVAGSAVQATITESTSGNPAAWAQLIVGSGGGGGGSSSEGSASSDGGSSEASDHGTPSRITQLPRLIVAGVEPDARTTQLVRLVLGFPSPPTRMTQLVRLIVGAPTPPIRTTQLVRLVVAAGVACVTSWCQCWRITRKDGRVFRFTSLDEDFPWGGEIFQACASLNPSAAEAGTAVGQVGSMELQGIIADDGITEADLYGGLFDDAFVEVWLVPWNDDANEAPRRLAAGWAGNLSHGRERGFNMEVIGPGARIDQQALVQEVTPQCGWVFGSPQCTIDREAMKKTGEVTHVTNRGVFAADLDAPSSSSAHTPQWADGTVRWTSGRNAGQLCEVKTADVEGDGVIVLWALPAYLPEPGDQFDLLPGCDLSKHACLDIYDNYINFGGFPDVPGDDAIAATPDAKV